MSWLAVPGEAKHEIIGQTLWTGCPASTHIRSELLTHCLQQQTFLAFE